MTIQAHPVAVFAPLDRTDSARPIGDVAWGLLFRWWLLLLLRIPDPPSFPSKPRLRPPKAP